MVIYNYKDVNLEGVDAMSILEKKSYTHIDILTHTHTHRHIHTHIHTHIGILTHT